MRGTLEIHSIYPPVHIIVLGGMAGSGRWYSATAGRLIRPFDPWKNPLCTCPRKYSLDPYTGCTHRCIYCYATSYIKDFYECRPKRRLVEIVSRDLKRLPPGSLISMCNSSDPYPSLERDLNLTRRCLEEFRKFNLRILIITKSDLVTRDIDLLKQMRAAVTISITTCDEWLARKLEPHAPSPSKRLDAIAKLSEEGIMTGLRLDPIIPLVNDENFETLLSEARDAGVRHVVSSTFKPRHDSWKRIVKVFPEIEERLRRIYIVDGEKIGASRYAPRHLRFGLMKKVSDKCSALGVGFATCREGFPELHSSPTCDGSHMTENV